MPRSLGVASGVLSSPTYDLVRVLEVDGARARLLLARVPEPPFDDPLMPGLALMLLHAAASLPEAAGTEAPILELSVDRLLAQPRPPALIARYVYSVHEVARRNEAPDFHAECRERFADNDEARSHEAYCAFFRDESEPVSGRDSARRDGCSLDPASAERNVLQQHRLRSRDLRQTDAVQLHASSRSRGLGGDKKTDGR